MTTATARSPRRESCLAVSHATDSSAASNPKTATTTGTSNVRAGSPSRPAARRNARTHRAAHSRARVDTFETRSTVSSTLGRSSANLAHRGMRERARARARRKRWIKIRRIERARRFVIVHRETDARENIHQSRDLGTSDAKLDAVVLSVDDARAGSEVAVAMKSFDALTAAERAHAFCEDDDVARARRSWRWWRKCTRGKTAVGARRERRTGESGRMRARGDVRWIA